MIDPHEDSSENLKQEMDLLEVKKKDSLNCSFDEESEASLSIAYMRLKSSFEEESEISASLAYQRIQVNKAGSKRVKTAKRGRPYKVCSSRYTERKGIVAACLEELLDKGMFVVKSVC